MKKTKALSVIEPVTLKKTWEDMGHNMVLIGKGFFISYNPNAGGSIFDMMLGESGLYEETALCVDDESSIVGTSYYILNGDFRKEYEALLPKGLKACLKFYKSKRKEYGSKFSSK